MMVEMFFLHELKCTCKKCVEIRGCYATEKEEIQKENKEIENPIKYSADGINHHKNKCYCKSCNAFFDNKTELKINQKKNKKAYKKQFGWNPTQYDKHWESYNPNKYYY